MARDRQLPSFLAKVHPRKGVPVNATLLVAAVSLAVGLFFYELSNGIARLSTLVNLGALTAFLALHVSVVWHFVGRQGSRHWWKHLIAPVIGFAILAFVLINAEVYAQALGLVWLAVGLVIMFVLLTTGRKPELNLTEEETR